MAKKGKKKQRSEPKKESAGSRLLLFAVVAGAISGYLLLKAGQDGPVRPVEESPASTKSQPRAEAAQPPKSWSSGDTLPPVPLLSLSGERLELSVSGDSKPLLLFIFSPTCSICTQTIPIWKGLFDEAKARSIEVVGISVLDTTRTSRYVNQHPVPWEVFSTAGRDAVQALRVEKVPMTVLVEASGNVRAALRGRLDDVERAQVLKFLKGDQD
jgi:peroxiredoxin